MAEQVRPDANRGSQAPWHYSGSGVRDQERKDQPVQPEHAGSACWTRRVAAILDIARQRVELIQLAVVRDNEQARRLYGNLGFLEYGIEKNALKQNGRYYDE